MLDKELLDHFAAVALPAIITANQEVSFSDMCDELLDDTIDKGTREHRQYMFSHYAASIAYGYAEAMIYRRESIHEALAEELLEIRRLDELP